MNSQIHLNIVGRKNSGKTYLIEALVKEFIRRGIRVGTIKHTSHDHEFDTPNTDSWKHMQAGSQTTIIISPTKWVCHKVNPAEDQVAGLMESALEGLDLVLWEGDQNTHNPLIECVRNGANPRFMADNRLEAIVSNENIPNAPQLFRFDQVEQICQWIDDRWGLKVRNS